MGFRHKFITEVYGKKAFEFRQNSIVVTLPFTILDDKKPDKVVDKSVDKSVDKVIDKSVDKNISQKSKTERIMMEIRNNPNITQPQLASITGLGKTTIQKYISNLKKEDFIERIGSNKKGYWRVLV